MFKRAPPPHTQLVVIKPHSLFPLQTMEYMSGKCARQLTTKKNRGVLYQLILLVRSTRTTSSICHSLTIDTGSEHKQDDFQLKAFGGNGINRLGQKPLNKTASRFHLVAILAEEEGQPRRHGTFGILHAVGYQEEARPMPRPRGSRPQGACSLLNHNEPCAVILSQLLFRNNPSR